MEKSQTITRVADFYINGLVDPSIYGVKVIDLSGKHTVIGEILNEGNSDGLFWICYSKTKRRI